MKLFYFPGACSIGIHALLEEIGKPYELLKVDFLTGAQFKHEYTDINPKAKVPALLRDDGTLVTEWPAIAWYLAKSNPQLGMIPADLEGETRLLEVLDYMIATVHMRGFTRIFRSGAFTPTKADEPAVQQTGRDIIADGFKLLSHTLGEKTYLLGEYSIGDLALFMLEFWAGARLNLPMPENLKAHYERMCARPAVQRTLAAEGFA
ncbi:glutathione S-transferase family protein [Acidocella sp. KAb 2-4]|uniref:glutathione S-transferase family protein n=1 Tax=Acidocella sp. KAb 2-4 TaxID=2885158 RepID=UPI001D094A5D|nr:glutathione S-transferase [Acidocella sp. KAb 2-4]MCB5945278.1 glutathione S-transferase [Acidocella sp. KAb 2-4]